MITMRSSNERGMAMITTLLVMMLMSALLVGFTTVVMSDQRYRFIDRDRNQAFYAASGGIEKMTADLGNLFLGHVAPTATQVTALTTTSSKPVIDNVSFAAPLAAETVATSSLTKCAAPNAIASTGSPGYTIRFCAAPNGNPTTTSTTPIKTGPYEGLIAQQMPYQLDVSAKTATGGEVHLVRTMEAVAIPVFQFGIFSDVDLSFFAGPNFNFGGRVHTNQNLFLSEGNGSTLTLSDKVTAVKEVIRQRMQNGASIDAAPAHTGVVSMALSPGVFRSLLRTEGSVIDGINSANNEPLWHTTSLSAYNSWIRNGRTGAKTLNLSLITVGGSNPDMIRRPPAGEDVANPVLLSERLFTKASLRVLLSDTAADITNLPGVTLTPPVQLDNAWRAAVPNNGIAPYGPIDVAHPPIARSTGPMTATITPAVAIGSVAAGNPRTVVFTGPSTANYFKIPDTLVVTKGANTWTLTGCSNQKTSTRFTCTAVAPSHAANTTAPATVSATVVTPDGNLPMTTQTTATWTGGTLTLDVVSTLGFAPHSFWVGNDIVTCGGYTSPFSLNECNVPTAIANNAQLTMAAHSNPGTGTIGGFIKIERQATDGTWNDVTMEILNYGMADRNLVLGNSGGNAGGAPCADPTPNAIIRVQRLKENNWGPTPSTVANCPPYINASTDFVPNTLFDTREGILRDAAPAGGALALGGVMHYINLDVQNLSRWFRGTGNYGASTGVNSKLDNGGYTVYFSDRRNNRNNASLETGDYGFEDFVNPAAADGSPNGVLDAGEDINATNALETYGSTPTYNAVFNAAPPGASAPLTAAANHRTAVTRGQAEVNRALLFRRALKLTNGTNIAGLGVTGLSVVSENPVYVQGDWNAAGATFGGAHAATAVMADAVTLLSNSWNDLVSFVSPYSPTPGGGNPPVPLGRNRNTQTWYRLAIISGKGASFPQPAGTSSDFGTDGGAHNFLRYLENGDQAVNYRGSMATFFFNRQGVGTFKCCNTVYAAPQRNYAFDIDFLNPALLPPNTPMFRDLNTVGFAQEMRPGR